MDKVVRFETRHGPMMVIEGDRFLSLSLGQYGEYCGAEWKLYSQLVKPGMTVVEAGANIGAFTVPLARACAPATLYALEPQQRLFQLLCANLVLNDVKNVVALPQAAGDTEGFADLPPIDYGAAENFGSYGVVAQGRGATRVRVVTVDSLELTECGLLKVDVEGFEPQVLRGAAETIRRCRPVLYVENDRKAQQQEVIDLIHGLDYRMYWHVSPLFSADNFKGVSANIFGGAASLNLLCLPAERGDAVAGAQAIDPRAWRAPF